MALFGWLTLALGRGATRWLLHPICWYFVAFSPRARRASKAFLGRALGRKPRLGEVLRHFYTFAATLHDRVFLLSEGEGAFEIEVHGADAVESALRAGHGCILLGSHLGSFEMVRALGRSAAMRPVNIVMHSGDAAHTARLLSRIAPELKDRVIAPGRPETVLKVKECLDRGEIVGMRGDRPFGGGQTHACDFLGSQAQFPLGPLLIAGTLAAPVVTFFGLYQGGSGYRVYLEALAGADPVPRAGRNAWAVAQLERYVERLAHYARRAPCNWFNFYDFWNQEHR